MTAPAVAIGKGETPQAIALKLANRHGLIAGATGTGKTVTLQVLAEGFSRAGVPVFVADVKGDLSGLSRPGSGADKLTDRARELGAEDYRPEASPTVFWDLFGTQGHPIRTTIAEMGPLLLARLMELNDTQEGVLNVAFRAADDEGLLLLDLDDLRSLLVHVAENAQALTLTYGNVSKASVGAIQRRLLQLEQEGAEQFFGEPALDLADLMRGDLSGRGIINVLMADKLMQSPRLYATFLLWLLAELFEQLPEVGDPDKPKLVFFFDEAHLLFDSAPPALLEKVEQVVRLIRSKGVGVYFVTQNPLDIPPSVLDQLGNRVQHALRAFTPRQQKAVRAAAETFRANPGFATNEVITQLAVGEALISTLEQGGVPAIVDRAKVLPPRSRMGPITAEERRKTMQFSPVRGRYDEAINRASAAELLQQRAFEKAMESRTVEAEAKERKEALEEVQTHGTSRRISGRSGRTRSKPRSRRTSRRQSVGEAFAKSVARSVGSQVGRSLIRGLMGSLLKR